MGEATAAHPVALVCAVLTCRQEWLTAARDSLEDAFGPVDLVSDVWPWDFSDYYAGEMGPQLLRVIYGFRNLVGPADLPAIKRATNAMELRLAGELCDAPPRPVNLDPGYVTLAKMVLATTKDFAHRLYLGDGIYAESTLRFRKKQFEPWEWTYPDYRTAEYREFFGRVRECYKDKLATAGGS